MKMQLKINDPLNYIKSKIEDNYIFFHGVKKLIRRFGKDVKLNEDFEEYLIDNGRYSTYFALFDKAALQEILENNTYNINLIEETRLEINEIGGIEYSGEYNFNENKNELINYITFMNGNNFKLTKLKGEK